jgi:uncharacterized RDD family membrane protein YckC
MTDPTQPPPPDPPGGSTPGAEAPTPPPYAAAEQPAPPYGAPPGQQPPGGYAPAPGGYGAPAGGAGAPADLLNRFLARLIDFIVLGVVNAIIDAIIVVGIFGLNGGNFGLTMGSGYAAGVVTSIIAAVLYLGYFAVMESRTGQTLGKMVLKLRTEGPDGGPPSMEVAVRRNFWVALGILGIIPFIGGLIGALAELVIVILIAVTINNSPTRQGWHDTFAGGTRVVRTG